MNDNASENDEYDQVGELTNIGILKSESKDSLVPPMLLAPEGTL